MYSIFKFSLKSLLKTLVRKSISALCNLNNDFAEILETDLKRIQGKGIGHSEDKSIEVNHATNLLKKIGIDEPIVWDVGANQGLYTKAILQKFPRAQVYAFEPSPFLLNNLSATFENDPRVTILPFALGRQTSQQLLFSDKPGSGLASFTQRRLDHFGISMKESQLVDVVAGDELISKFPPPDFIKIDVEGHEMDVLEGAINIVAKTKVIAFEFGGTHIDTRTFFQDFFYFFTHKNFKIYRISIRKLILIKKYSEEDEYFRPTNYICVRDN
jgi:FkbM family methyltransferase